MAVWKSIRTAIERFDKAAQDYALRGTYFGNSRYGAVVEEYHVARIALNEAIGKALGQSFRDGAGR